jgi:DNA ligase 1
MEREREREKARKRKKNKKTHPLFPLSSFFSLKKLQQQDYLDGVGDTFDVVVLGAWHGRGKRTGVYGAFLLAIYDERSESYQSISKIGTGFREEQLESIAAKLATHVISQPRPYYAYGETLTPDVWFEPAVVWEVKAADLSVSPVHKAGLGLVDRNKGISIRFPRLVRERDDKRPEQATSAAQVADMYRRQALTMNQAEVDGEKKNGKGGGGGDGGGANDDDDYY